jgi:cytoskeletal protein CcmA (bactofilin family)
MFTKDNKTNADTLDSKESVPPSLLSINLEVSGDLRSNGEIQIDGTINGNIHSDVLVVGPNAIVNGDIVAGSVRIHGHVTGEVKANSVSLSKTAHILGDILHSDISIEQGAFLEGHCRRTDGLKKPDEGALRFLTNSLLADDGKQKKD